MPTARVAWATFGESESAREAVAAPTPAAPAASPSPSCRRSSSSSVGSPALDGFVDAGATIGDAWKADIVFGINAPAEDELPPSFKIHPMPPPMNPAIRTAITPTVMTSAHGKSVSSM